MPRLSLGLGLNLPRPIFLGGGIPSEPTGFVAKYTAYLVDNFTLVTGDSVNVWADESVNNNDLTQGTSANQPKLVEDNTVTQFTASSQPTFALGVDSRESLSFDAQGDHIISDNEFGVDWTGDWTLEWEISSASFGTSFVYMFTRGGGNTPNIRTLISGGLRVTANDASIIMTAGGGPSNTDVNKLLLRRTGNTLEYWLNDISIDSSDMTGKELNIGCLSRSNNDVAKNFYSVRAWSVAVADPVNPTETPTQTLTPDPTAMRTSANANPVLGEDVAKWYADEFSAYRDARVVFDATDDNMSGLPALTGDWSYMIDTSINTLGTTKYLLEQTAGSSAILALADNYMYLRDTTGANDIALTSYTLTTGRTQFGFVRSGDDLLYYVDGVLKETVDVTGRTFDFGTIGKSATSADMDTKQIIPFDRALTQTEIDYYSYLRSETGEILLPPLLPS